MRPQEQEFSLERVLNRPVMGWFNALLGDPRLPIPVVSTFAAYHVSPNDPVECLTAGIVVGVIMGVTNALIYARIEYEGATSSIDILLSRHPPRLVRTWAETNGRLDEYHDAIQDMR